MEKNKLGEIEEAFSDTGAVYAHDNQKTVAVLTRAVDMLGDLIRCERLVKRILDSKNLNYSIGFNKRLNRNFIKNSKLGEDIVFGLRVDVDGIKDQYPMHRFNPYVDLFFRVGAEKGLFGVSTLRGFVSQDDMVKQVDLLNGFVDAVRLEGKNKEFKVLINNFKRSSNKNYAELILYIRRLFSLHSRLLVLRVDFGYKKQPCWPNATETPVNYEAFRMHREMLFRYISAELPNKCLVGYAWKMEYGLDKSYHIHAMVFLDGSKVREDVTIARIIGEHWSSAITEGKGLYYNCNAYKGNYKSCGIGTVHYDDAESYEGLRKAALYMTKPDYYIQVVTPGKGRAFGKGIMPAEKVKMDGRPRSRVNAII